MHLCFNRLTYCTDFDIIIMKYLFQKLILNIDNFRNKKTFAYYLKIPVYSITGQKGDMNDRTKK